MTTTTFAYRDDLEGARLQYADALERICGGRGLASATRVLSARTGRRYAGVVGLAGALLMVASAGVEGLLRAPETGTATVALLLSWPAMGAAYLLGRAIGTRSVAVPRTTGDVHADLARLQGIRPLPEARRRADALEWASTALPMMAVGLLSPLTLHFFAAFLMGQATSFDAWIQCSIVVVGHAHAALAVLYWRFATQAGQLESSDLAAKRSRLEWRTFGIVVGASALPGAVLLLLPPLLTALTALLFHPLLFRTMTRTIVAERQALA